MRQKYDVILKDIFKDVPKAFLKILTGYETGKFIDVQFPDIQLRLPDLVIEVQDGNLVHIEIQAKNENNMMGRMYLYSGFMYNQHKKLPIQIVLYVGNEPLNMQNHMEGEGVKYSYKLIDIREIDCRLLLESDSPEDIVLAILCKTGDVDTTIKTILDKLSLLPQKEREGYIRKLLYLSDLRKLYPKVKMEVSKMPITIDVRDSDIFQEGVLEGERKGLLEGERKGLMEGERKGLLEGIELGLELKFGSAGLGLMDMVRIIPAVDKLEELKNLIRTADSLDILKEFLGKSV
jgi:predicted transposase YdaD